MLIRKLLFFVIFLWPSFSKASYEGHQIELIGQVEHFVDLATQKLRQEGISNPEKRILVLFDWDRTITMGEGTNFPLSEPLGNEQAKTKSTAGMIESLNHKGVGVMFLTARGNGREMAAPEIRNMLTAMGEANAFGGSSPIKSTLQPKQRVIKFKPRPNSPNTEISAITVTDHVVFAGSRIGASLKAYATTQMMDQGLLVTQPSIIIFVDNTKKHLDGFAAAFRSRPEEVIGLYYPKYGDEGGDGIQNPESGIRN